MLSGNHDNMPIQHQSLILYNEIICQENKGQISPDIEQGRKVPSAMHHLRVCAHPGDLIMTPDNN